MILEIATLIVKPGFSEQFEADFRVASKYISSIEGYISHSLQKCIELTDKYVLLVEWQTLENHTIGFRESSNYVEWKKLLHHYYEPYPIVEHYQEISGKCEETTMFL